MMCRSRMWGIRGSVEVLQEVGVEGIKRVAIEGVRDRRVLRLLMPPLGRRMRGSRERIIAGEGGVGIGGFTLIREMGERRGNGVCCERRRFLFLEGVVRVLGWWLPTSS